jgi:hypothetical protein
MPVLFAGSRTPFSPMEYDSNEIQTLNIRSGIGLCSVQENFIDVLESRRSGARISSVLKDLEYVCIWIKFGSKWHSVPHVRLQQI